MSARYVPGTSLVLVGEDGVVVTGQENTEGLVALLERDLTPLAVIEALSQGSLADLTDFACAVVDGADLRIVLRGGFTATAEETTWSGEAVATWREQTVVGGAGTTVVIEALDADPVRSWPELPVGAGIVLASRVAWARSAGTPAPPVASMVRREQDAVPVAEHTMAEVEFAEASQGGDGGIADGGVDSLTRAHVPEGEAEPGDGAGTDHEPEELAAPAAPVTPATPGDHDGRTITADQLKALREQDAAAPAHAPAVVVLPDGTQHPVAPRLLIGRRPEARQISSGEVPTVVTVSGPYISSTHLDVLWDGARVLVTDLSTNGTLVMGPGQPIQTLVKGQATEVGPGTRVALSDDFQVSIDLAPGG